MNIENIFKKFLENEVNLNPARHSKIKAAVDVLAKFIANHDDFKELYVGITAQGSYRQKTIIKPVDEHAEFDVDLLIELKENDEWEPKNYLLKLAQAFKDSGRYEDLTETSGKTRCVTIEYEGDFHVDLVPAIKKGGIFHICNKIDNKFEKSDGDGYAQWFDNANKLANGHLIHVVRLIKYLRDRHEDFDTKSIIITTLVGMVVPVSNSYSNLPESFATILSSLNYFLAEFKNPPTIKNPVMPEETFDRHWKVDIAGFKKFKNAISAYSKIANNAIVPSGDDAVQQWQNLFGENFGISSENDKGESSVNIINNSGNLGGFTPRSPWCDNDINRS